MNIQPANEFVDKDTILVQYRGKWRKVAAVLRQKTRVRVFLEVAEITSYESSTVALQLCEIVAIRLVGSRSTSELLRNQTLEVTPLPLNESVDSLRWIAVAYQSSKPDKEYQNLPEIYMIGLLTKSEQMMRVCCSRSRLRKLYDIAEVDCFLVPVMTAIHGRNLADTGKSWIPQIVRHSSRKLNGRIELSVKAYTKRRSQTRVISSLVQQCIPAKTLVDSKFPRQQTPRTKAKGCFSTLGSTVSAPTSDRSEYVAVAVLADCPGNRKASYLESLPNELLNTILDYVQYPDLLSYLVAGRIGSFRQTDNPCLQSKLLVTDDNDSRDISSQKLDFPAMLLTSKRMKEVYLDWSSRQEFTFVVSRWPSALDIQDPLVKPICEIRKARIDCSGLTYDELRSQHPLIVQLTKTWTVSNSLTSIALFVPPDIELESNYIPWDQRLDGLTGPLLHCSSLKNKIHWDPTDFSGEVTYGTSALCIAAMFSNVELLRSILRQSRATINTKGRIGGMTPLCWGMVRENLEIVRQLLGTEEIDVNAAGCYFLNPIHMAIKTDNEELVMLLLEKGGVDLFAGSPLVGPLEIAQSHPRIHRLLLSYLSHLRSPEAEVPPLL